MGAVDKFVGWMDKRRKHKSDRKLRTQIFNQTRLIAHAAALDSNHAMNRNKNRNHEHNDDDGNEQQLISFCSEICEIDVTITLSNDKHRDDNVPGEIEKDANGITNPNNNRSNDTVWSID